MELSQLPVEQGFRLRGQQVTRLETFVDAAFAFSLTLLVIFFNDLPDTVAELRDALAARADVRGVLRVAERCSGRRTTAGAGASGWRMRSRRC